jgi:hypothetical protein
MVFVHASPVFGGVVAEIVGSLSASREVAAAEFCVWSSEAILDVAAETSVLIVSDVHAVLGTDGSDLFRFHEKSQSAVQAGMDLCLIARRSRESFPIPRGSSIILDSYPYALPLCEPSPGDAYRLTVIPSVRVDPALDFRELYRELLLQVSTAALLDLDRAVFSMGVAAETCADELSHLVQDELRRAGLLSRGLDGEISFSVPARYNSFRLALGDVISALVSPPPWMAGTFDALFEIERIIRNSCRGAAIEERGDRWRRGLLQEAQSAEVVGRARDGGFLLAEQVEELRDPLEWLTLGELMGLARSRAFGGLSLSASVWDNFAHEVLPVRNRLGHMRLSTEEDNRTVRKWRAILSKVLVNSQ